MSANPSPHDSTVPMVRGHRPLLHGYLERVGMCPFRIPLPEARVPGGYGCVVLSCIPYQA